MAGGVVGEVFEDKLEGTEESLRSGWWITPTYDHTITLASEESPNGFSVAILNPHVIPVGTGIASADVLISGSEPGVYKLHAGLPIEDKIWGTNDQAFSITEGPAPKPPIGPGTPLPKEGKPPTGPNGCSCGVCHKK